MALTSRIKYHYYCSSLIIQQCSCITITHIQHYSFTTTTDKDSNRDKGMKNRSHSEWQRYNDSQITFALQQIVELQYKQQNGQILDQQQLNKIQRKQELKDKLEQIRNGTFKLEQPRHPQIHLTMDEKIPEFSSNVEFQQFIDQIDTNYYDKRQRLNRLHIDRFASKRKAQLKDMLQEPDLYHPVIFDLLSANNGSDILNVLNNMDMEQFSKEEDYDDEFDKDRNLHPTLHRIYSKAIRCAADMGEYSICWQIFEQCKKDQIISNELYCTMMWVVMYNKRSEHALDKVFKLHDELKQAIIDYNLQVHPRTYSTLINSCMKARKYNAAHHIIQSIKEENPETLRKASHTTQAMLQFYSNTLDIDNAMELMETIASNDETVWCRFDVFRLHELLYAISKRVASGFNKDNFIKSAEKVFKNCISMAIRNDVNVPVNIFNGMIKVYANNDDYHSCMDLLKYMIHPSKKHKLFPSPTIHIFENVLLSLLNEESMDEKWKKIDDIFKIMEKLNISKSFAFYCRLFNVCNDDLERAKKFYQDMIAMDGIEPNMALLQTLFNVGIKHYNNVSEKQQFIKWIVNEYNKYDVIPTEQIKYEWKTAWD